MERITDRTDHIQGVVSVHNSSAVVLVESRDQCRAKSQNATKIRGLVKKAKSPYHWNRSYKHRKAQQVHLFRGNRCDQQKVEKSVERYQQWSGRSLDIDQMQVEVDITKFSVVAERVDMRKQGELCPENTDQIR